jgi:CheY-like chemotaxis protein
LKEQPLILAAARNQRHLGLVTQFLSKEGDFVKSANRLEALDLAVSQSKAIGLALVDMDGFYRRVWERCERIRDRQIPFLRLLPQQSAAIEPPSLAHGAQSQLLKPLVVKKFLGIVRSLERN